MAFIFPSNPNIGDLVTNPSSGQIFRWNGFAWGGDSANALLTASFAFTASYLLGDGGSSVSSSYSDTASYAYYSETASYAFYAVSASHEITHEISSSYSDTASYVQTAQTASYFLTSSVTSASLAQTASFYEEKDTLQSITTRGNHTSRSLSISASLAQGSGSVASGIFSHAQGILTTAVGNYSHAEGETTTAVGFYSHAEGTGTKAIGAYSHAEGDRTSAAGAYSHAEGRVSEAIGAYSHAEGDRNTAIGNYSHVEGSISTTTGVYSHAEGSRTIAIGAYSHAEGSLTTAIGEASHAQGFDSVASGDYQTVVGQFNQLITSKSAFIIGDGTSEATRHNLLYASGGRVDISGSLIAPTITGSLQGTASNALTASYVETARTASYFLTSSVTSASLSQTASLALNFITSSVTSASYALTASHVLDTKDVGFQKEWHVSVGSGSDATGNGSLSKPFATLGKAFSVVGGTGEQIVVHPGLYLEAAATLTQPNITICGANGNTGGIAYINGTVTIAPGSSSTRINGILFNNLIHSGSAGLYLEKIQVKANYTKIGTGYSEIVDTDLQASGSIVFKGGTTVIHGDKQGLVISSGSGTAVYIKNSFQVISPSAVAGGTLVIDNSIVYPLASGSAAITSQAGTVVYLYNSNITTATGLPERINIGGFLGYHDTVFNKNLSTLGTSLNIRSNFQSLDANNLTATGSLFGTASWSLNATSANTASWSNNAISANTSSWANNFLTSSVTNATFAQSASYVDIKGKAITVNYVGSQIQLTGSADPFPYTGDAQITGSLTITGDIVARKLTVIEVTSSVDYSSGSNIFGDAPDDIQTLNGQVNIYNNATISGSLVVLGGITGSLLGTASYALTASHALMADTASYALSASDAQYSVSASHALIANDLVNIPSLQAITTVGNSTSQSISIGVDIEMGAPGTPLVYTFNTAHQISTNPYKLRFGGIFGTPPDINFFVVGNKYSVTADNFGVIGIFTTVVQVTSIVTDFFGGYEVFCDYVSGTESFGSIIAISTFAAPADYAFGQGQGVKVSANSQHVVGLWNSPVTESGAFVVGNGIDDANRSNLIYANGSQVQISGSTDITGSLFLNGTEITGGGGVSASYAQTASVLVDGADITIGDLNISGIQTFVDDAEAAVGGIPVNGVYRNGNFLMIRIS